MEGSIPQTFNERTQKNFVTITFLHNTVANNCNYCAKCRSYYDGAFILCAIR